MNNKKEKKKQKQIICIMLFKKLLHRFGFVSVFPLTLVSSTEDCAEWKNNKK